MVGVPLIDQTGSRSTINLEESVFGVPANIAVMHEVVKAQLAAQRAGTHSTKSRGEVRGGGKKPWRQKGTGRARQGSIRQPQWVGGGVAHGPTPRSHGVKVNRKVRRLAFCSALSDRVAIGRLIVVDFPDLDEPSTKQALQLLGTWEVEGKILLIVDPSREEQELSVWKSFRNLSYVKMVAYPTVVEILTSDWMVFTSAAMMRLNNLYGLSVDGQSLHAPDVRPESEASTKA